MSTPAPVLPWDPCNPLLASIASQLDTAVFVLENGSRAAMLTIRTASTTTTVLLNAADLSAWHRKIGELEGQLQESGVAMPTAAETAAFGNGRIYRMPSR